MEGTTKTKIVMWETERRKWFTINPGNGNGDSEPPPPKKTWSRNKNSG